MKFADEQIEKAAKAAHESRAQNLHMPSNWDRQHEWDRIVERRAIRAALEAVIPGEPVVCRETLDMHHNEACGTQDNHKPCPFCGGEAEIEELYDSYVARCSNTACPVNVETCFCESEDEAAAIWNRRPAPEPGELERLRAIALGVIALEDEPDAYPSPDTERLIAQARDVLDGRRHPTAERLRALCIRNAEMREALEWYAGKVRDCRKIGPEGDAARAMLDADAGKRARAALAEGDGDE